MIFNYTSKVEWINRLSTSMIAGVQKTIDMICNFMTEQL